LFFQFLTIEEECEMNALAQKLVVAATWRRTAICGHKTPLEGEVEVFGESIRLRVPVSARKQPYFCLQCLGAAAIRCAWCARAIVPGDKVTLFRPYEGFVVPEHAVVYSRTPLKLVGCMHPDCVDQNGHECGTWQLSATSRLGYVGDLEYGKRAFRCAMESSRLYVPPKDSLAKKR
jgi:hypothetical protein